MNLKQWIDDILKKLGADEEVKAELINERHYLPDAVYSGTLKEILMYGNPPSFARLGIAYLLSHELAHHEHMKLHGNPGDDSDEEFRRIERLMLDKLWDICLEVHD